MFLRLTYIHTFLFKSPLRITWIRSVFGENNKPHGDEIESSMIRTICESAMEGNTLYISYKYGYAYFGCVGVTF